MKKKKISLLNIICVLMFILSIFIFGLMDLFIFGFDSSYIATATFWLPMLTRTFANGLILVSTVVSHINQLTDANEQIKHYKNFITLAAEKDIKTDFVEFIAEENLATKIKSYKAKINSKIIKLEKRASAKDLDQWRIYQEKGVINDIEASKYCKYVYKRQKLLSKLTHEYIDENIDYIQIKYEIITRNMILSGCESKNKESSKYSLINENKKMIRDLFPRFLITMGFTLILASMVPEINKTSLSDLSFWIKFAVNLVTLIFNYFTGTTYAKTFVDTVIIGNYLTRKRAIEDYKTWKVNRGA